MTESTSPTQKPKRRPQRKRITIREHGPAPVDVLVGERVRLRRTLLGMSQTTLADALNVSFQQVQKYEKGVNRLSASGLWQVANVLDVSVSYFFETADSAPTDRKAFQATRDADRESDPMVSRETLELIRAFHRIDSETVRDRLRALIAAAAGAGPGDGDGDGAP